MKPTALTTAPRPSLLARLGLPFVLILCITQSWRPLGGGFDFWAHATVGRWIADHHTFPTHSLFLWSSPGFKWVYHSWLSQLAFYEIVHLFTPVGVMVFNTVMVCATFALLWRLWHQRAGVMPFFAPLVFFGAIFVSSPRFQPRQELLTALLLVVFLGWLLRYHEARTWEERNARSAPLLEKKSFAVIALFALWINLHALVLLPLVLLWAAALADSIQYRLDGRSRALLLLAVLCSLATLCNPWGWGYWAAASVLKPGSQAMYVQEWWPVWKGWPDMATSVYGNSTLMAFALFGWIFNRRRRWAELLWLLGTAALFARSRRLMWILAIVCLVVIASNAASYSTGRLWARWRTLSRQQPGPPPRIMRYLAHGSIALLLVICTASLATEFHKNRSEYVPLTGVSRHAPRAAADWVNRHHPPGRTFTDYEFSSYFHWRFNGADKGVRRVTNLGRRPLYADLLNDYPDAVLKNYFEILDATKKGLYLIDHGSINTLILGQPHFSDKIGTALDKNPAWKRAYSDANARIWVRRKPLAPQRPAPSALTNRKRKRPETHQVPPPPHRP